MRRRVYDEPGHLHFVTFSCDRRRRLLNQDRCKRIVISHLERTRAQFAGRCIGFVVMPEHVHVLIGFDRQGSLSLFKQEWKRQSSLAITEYFRKRSNPVLEHLRRPEGGYRVWTPKQYDFNVFSEEKALEKLEYMHNNPVNRGLVEKPEDWDFGSARWYARGVSVGVTLTHLGG